jgi:hypothetical protein
MARVVCENTSPGELQGWAASVTQMPVRRRRKPIETPIQEDLADDTANPGATAVG